MENPVDPMEEPVPPAVKLVGHWTFNGPNAPTKANTADGKRPATFEGDPTSADGPVGKAIVLDGDGDAVVLPAGLFDPKGGSIAFWVRPTYETGSEYLFVAYPIRISRDKDSKLSVGIGTKTAAGGQLVGGKWSHVGLVWSPGKAHLLLDGKVVATIDNVGVFKAPTSVRFGVNNVKLLATGGMEKRYHPLAIDDVRVHAGQVDPATFAEAVSAANVPAPIAPRPRPVVVTLPAPRFPPGGKGRVLVETWVGLKGKGIAPLNTRVKEGSPKSAVVVKQQALAYDQPGGAANGVRVTGYLVPPKSGVYAFHGGTGVTLSLSNDRRAAGLKPVKFGAGVRLAANEVRWFDIRYRHAQRKGTFRIGWTMPDGKKEGAIPASRLAYPVERRGFVPLVVGRDSRSTRSETTFDEEARAKHALLVEEPDAVEPGETFTVSFDPRFREITALLFVTEQHRSLPGGGPGTESGGKFSIGEIEFHRRTADGKQTRVAFREPTTNLGAGKLATDGDPERAWSVSNPGKRHWLLLLPTEPIRLAENDRLTMTIVNENPVGYFRVKAISSTRAANEFAEAKPEAIEAYIETKVFATNAKSGGK